MVENLISNLLPVLEWCVVSSDLFLHGLEVDVSKLREVEREKKEEREKRRERDGDEQMSPQECIFTL